MSCGTRRPSEVSAWSRPGDCGGGSAWNCESKEHPDELRQLVRGLGNRVGGDAPAPEQGIAIGGQGGRSEQAGAQRLQRGVVFRVLRCLPSLPRVRSRCASTGGVILLVAPAGIDDHPAGLSESRFARRHGARCRAQSSRKNCTVVTTRICLYSGENASRSSIEK